MTQGPRDPREWPDDRWRDGSQADDPTRPIEVPPARQEDAPYWRGAERVTETSGLDPEPELPEERNPLVDWVARNARPLGVAIILLGTIVILLIGINAPDPGTFRPSQVQETQTEPVEETTEPEATAEETTPAQEESAPAQEQPEEQVQEDATEEASPEPITTQEQESAPEPESLLEPGQITNGSYEVGTQVAPDLYRIASKDALEPCTVTQVGAVGQSLDERATQEGDVIFPVQDVRGSRLTLDGCGSVWLARDTLREDPSEIANGYWLVGQEVAPGRYTAVRDEGSVTPEGAAWQTTEDGIIDTRWTVRGVLTFTVQDIPGSTVTFVGVKDIIREE